MAFKSIGILQYSYSDDLTHLQPLQEDDVIPVRADGTMMAGTS
jgi:hypothetical protein